MKKGDKVYFINIINCAIYLGTIQEDIDELNEYSIKLERILSVPINNYNKLDYSDENILLYVPKTDVFKSYKKAKKEILRRIFKVIEYYLVEDTEDTNASRVSEGTG